MSATSTLALPRAASVTGRTGVQQADLAYHIAEVGLRRGTFERTAASFDNPDHVDIVIHNFRWRLSLAQGEPQYGDLEARLFERPMITVPTITIGSDFDGPLRTDVPTRRSSRVRTRIESSKASDTTCPKKPRTRSPTPYSKSEEDWRELYQASHCGR